MAQMRGESVRAIGVFALSALAAVTIASATPVSAGAAPADTNTSGKRPRMI